MLANWVPAEKGRRTDSRAFPATWWIPLLAMLGSLWSMRALGEVSADQAEQTARNAFIERFTKFTEDKNVMGKPRSPDGKKGGGGKKTRFNNDDGLAYQSDLTYHDLSFNTIETEKADPNDKNAKVSRLFAFVSPHGGISAAGGSSQLERTAYALHKRFTKEDSEENQKKDDEKNGIKYRSIFKISTQEVIRDEENNGNGNGNNGNNNNQQAQNKKEVDKVERFEIREEARPEIEKVGEESFETIRRSGRDQGNENDETTMANGVLLRYAAGEATQALWNSTLANLVQRRVNRGMRAGSFPETPKLSETTPTCAAWQQTALGVLNKVNPDQRKALAEEVNRMAEQCQQLASLPFNAIDPRFETNKDGKEELKIGGPAKEDALIRDSRVQLEVLAKAGTDPSSVPSNWKYDAKDSKARVTIDFDDSGRAAGEREMTVKQQLESYNQQLQAAAEGYEEVRSRIPDLKVDTDAILGYQIQPGTRSLMDINKAPDSGMDEVGLPVPTAKRAQTYDELLQSSQSAGGAVAAQPGSDVTGVGESQIDLNARAKQAIGFDDGGVKR